jgi:hypothetical protein
MSAVVPPSYSVLVVDVEECRPIIRTGIDFLDRSLVCLGGYGITLTVVIIAFIVLLLLFR